ncbi:MAG: hypothetical protein FWE57_11245 [Chitinispirillia bacterium]|nr:hypothetical protein [Chitinispirillia bacterium]
MSFPAREKARQESSGLLLGCSSCRLILLYASACWLIFILLQRIVTKKAEFSVTTPGRANAAIVVYDNLGKAVFRSKSVRSGQQVTWNLINRQGRSAGNGSYLVIAAVRDASAFNC